MFLSQTVRSICYGDHSLNESSSRSCDQFFYSSDLFSLRAQPESALSVEAEGGGEAQLANAPQEGWNRHQHLQETGH